MKVGDKVVCIVSYGDNDTYGWKPMIDQVLTISALSHTDQNILFYRFLECDQVAVGTPIFLNWYHHKNFVLESLWNENLRGKI